MTEFIVNVGAGVAIYLGFLWGVVALEKWMRK